MRTYGIVFPVLLQIFTLSIISCSSDEADPECLQQCEEILDQCNSTCAHDKALCEGAGEDDCEAFYTNCLKNCKNSFEACENSCEWRNLNSQTVIGPDLTWNTVYNFQKMYYTETFQAAYLSDQVSTNTLKD